MNRFTALIPAFLLWIAQAAAHPVAQGNMEVTVTENEVVIVARVANEQVYVAEAHSKSGASEALADLWPRHGVYLLNHLQVRADKTVLQGELRKTIPPEQLNDQGRTTYEFGFPIPESMQSPGTIELSQSVLNEIEFAPGNRWEATYLTRFAHPSGQVQEGLLFTSREPLTLPLEWKPGADAPPSLNRGQLFKDYLHHGVMHILSGYDHLLFVAALVLAAITLRDLLAVVTAFTLAHTATLALSVFNIVRLPSSIVEPIIAGSIVVVALQNIFWPERSRGWTRLLLAFAFGLFHGLGFAGGLLESMEALPGIAITLALVAFSLGVEIGHGVVVLPLFGAIKTARAFARDERGANLLTANRCASALICFAGMFYFVAAVRG